MVAFVNQPQSRSAMLGASLGGGLGQGLSSGVQSLLEHKMQQLSSQRDQAKAYDFGQAIGLDPKMARAFSQLDPKSRQDIASNVFIGQLGQQPSQQDNQFMPPQENNQSRVEQLSQGFAPKSSVSDFNQQLFQDLGFIPKQAPLSQFGQKSQQPTQQEMRPQEQVAQQQAPMGKNPLVEAYNKGKMERDPRLALAAEKVAQGERKQSQQESEFEYKKQQSLKPYLTQQFTSFDNFRKASNQARDMLDNIEANESKWPGAIVGNLPSSIQNLVLRDENVRKFMADANSLVTLLAGTRKGVPTNFKIKLEQLSKADFSQPIKTQKALLRDVINKADEESNIMSYIESLKDKETGSYPLDIQSKVTKFEDAMDNPLKHPDSYQDGTVVEERGKRYTLKGGKWKAV